jgi:hypothetical protein
LRRQICSIEFVTALTFGERNIELKMVGNAVLHGVGFLSSALEKRRTKEISGSYFRDIWLSDGIGRLD